MNTGARLSAIRDAVQRDSGGKGIVPRRTPHASEQAKARPASAKTRVFIAAENRLLRETLAKMLGKELDFEVVGGETTDAFQEGLLLQTGAEVFLLTSRGNLEADLAVVREVRAAAPSIHILLMGMREDTGEFLRCVRAGVSGYLLRDAASEEVLRGIRAVRDGEAACPGSLCSVLFRYLESESATMPCASARRRWGLTRREQQLIPLIAQGLTNKEIANHFSLSEQTVKNHLYRMKHKVGAEDRLDIVQVYRTEGLLV